MAEFSKEGDDRFTFWTVNASKDWAIIPANTLKGFPEERPIRLQVGTKTWGQTHIEFRHSMWLKKIDKTVQEALFLKLAQSGSVYSTEDDNKIKIMMRIAPDSLLVLRLVNNKHGDFLTVVSLYYKNERVDGDALGRYKSTFQTSLLK